jgi:hypothetical protein
LASKARHARCSAGWARDEIGKQRIIRLPPPPPPANWLISWLTFFSGCCRRRLPPRQLRVVNFSAPFFAIIIILCRVINILIKGQRRWRLLFGDGFAII